MTTQRTMTDTEVEERWAQLGVSREQVGAWTGALWHQRILNQATPERPVMQVLVEVASEWIGAGWHPSQAWNADPWTRLGWDPAPALRAFRLGIRAKTIEELTDEERRTLGQV